jgi:hypothetical protein
VDVDYGYSQPTTGDAVNRGGTRIDIELVGGRFRGYWCGSSGRQRRLAYAER